LKNSCFRAAGSDLFIYISIFSSCRHSWAVHWATGLKKIWIWFSIHGELRLFTLLLPMSAFLDSSFIGDHRSNHCIGFFCNSCVRTELLPGKVGLISGLFLASHLDLGDLGSAALGVLLADRELFCLRRYVHFSR
jgi:hypothetical protein